MGTRAQSANHSDAVFETCTCAVRFCGLVVFMMGSQKPRMLNVLPRLDPFAFPAQSRQMNIFHTQEFETRADICCADTRTGRDRQALEYKVGNSLLQRCVLGHPECPGNKAHLQNVPRADPCNETCL